jgi:rhodanese-related sulfurtransferase
MAIEMSENIEDYFILDVRDYGEYEKESIDGSTNIPHRMILVSECDGSTGFHLKKIPKDKIILIYCASGSRALLVEPVLLKNGYEVLNILKYNLAEDFVNSMRKIKRNE